MIPLRERAGGKNTDRQVYRKQSSTHLLFGRSTNVRCVPLPFTGAITNYVAGQSHCEAPVEVL